MASTHRPNVVLNERTFDVGTEAGLKRPRVSGELACRRVKVRASELSGPWKVVGHGVLDRGDCDVRIGKHQPIMTMVPEHLLFSGFGRVLGGSNSSPRAVHDVGDNAVLETRSFDGVVDGFGDRVALFVQRDVAAQVRCDGLGGDVLQDARTQKVVDGHCPESCHDASRRSIFENLPSDVVPLVLARLPIETRVRLRVKPNKVPVPDAIRRYFESPIRANKLGQHVREGALVARWGSYMYVSMSFAVGDEFPMMKIGFLDFCPEWTKSFRLKTVNSSFGRIDMMIEACDGEFGADGEFVADFKRRLQEWVRVQEY